jgi:hypothetical protein
MGPVLRFWAIFATALALLFALRGAWPLALAAFFLSPAPAWAFAHGRGEQAHASATWLRAIAGGVAIVALLYAVVVVALGGLPPVHEWRGALVR